MTDLRDLLRSTAMFPRADLDQSVLAERATRRRRRRVTAVASSGAITITALVGVFSAVAAGDNHSGPRVETFVGASAPSDSTTTSVNDFTQPGPDTSVPDLTAPLLNPPTTAFVTPETTVVSGTTPDTTSPGTTTEPTPTTALPPPISGPGVVGSVTAGPTCPVEPAPGGCPPKPVTGITVQAIDGSGTMAGSDTTDSEGYFGITLAPGDYTLHVVTSGTFPICNDVPITVPSGGAAGQDIRCDTGIR